MARIFLSHSSANNAEALALKDWMAAQGWDDVFLDLDPKRGLVAGQRWQDALKRAADRCELVVFLVSPAWAASRWCLAEFLLAKQMSKRIFGVLVQETPFSDIPIEMTSEWQLVDLTAGLREHVMSVRTPDATTASDVAFANDGLTRLRIGLMQAGLDAKYFAWPPANDPLRSPYRGLKPLEAEDAGIFFGRDGPIVEALDRMRGLADAAAPRLMVILGASGAGKSSFLRAGLVPRLKRDPQNFHVLPVVRPGQAAISGDTGLLAALATGARLLPSPRTRMQIREVIAAGGDATAALLAEIARAAATTVHVHRAGPSPTLVLSIDQAEELFRSDGGGEALTLMALLGRLVTRSEPSMLVLFTIRSDRYELLQNARALSGLRQQTFSLPPMPQGSYSEVINGPARQLEETARKLAIEERLTEKLLEDMNRGGAKDALPLLAFTLERLYLECGENGELRLSDYETLGGIGGSIEAAVDRALEVSRGPGEATKEEEAKLARLRRGLIPWLAGIDPDNGQARRRVARLDAIPKDALPLLDRLVGQRLLSIDVASDTDGGAATIEVAHDAILRQWTQLKNWLIEDARLIAVLDGVKRRSRDWQANARQRSWLSHTGERLKAARTLVRERQDLSASLDAMECAYLAACVVAESASRRRIKALAASLLVAVAGFGTWINRDDIVRAYHWHTVVRPLIESEVEGHLLDGVKARTLKPGDTFRECRNGPLCPMMVVIPAGTFMMGSPETGDGRFPDEEGQQRLVRIGRAFAVSKFEVSLGEWNACVRLQGCAPGPSHAGANQGSDQRAVSFLTWHEASQYVAWLAGLTGKPYRLLTEAEWEYAARAGTTTRYSFGEAADALDSYAWFQGSFASNGSAVQDVGLKRPNGFGLYDMHGNVWEWVEDCWSANYVGAPSDGTAVVFSNCPQRVARGGAFDRPARSLRSANRYRAEPGFNSRAVGIRVARTIEGFE